MSDYYEDKIREKWGYDIKLEEVRDRDEWEKALRGGRRGFQDGNLNWTYTMTPDSDYYYRERYDGEAEISEDTFEDVFGFLFLNGRHMWLEVETLIYLGGE